MKFKLLKVTAISFLFIIGILSMLTLVNAIITPIEKHFNPAPGKMVEVDGGRMHVFTVGNGPKNVILLSGLGTPSPVYDFMQLSKDLQKDFTVTVVENFGYGWSDWTKKPRTNENIVSETRAALNKAEIFPPYILVAHSISGIYALFYANKYPQEVEAIVGLDASVAEFGDKIDSEKNDNFLEILRISGVARILLFFNPSLAQCNSSTPEDADNYKNIMITNWNIDNYTIRNEKMLSGLNCKELLNVKIPDMIPTSQILASKTIRDIPKIFPGMDWGRVHSSLVDNNKNSKIIVLDGDHYIHWANSRKIALIVCEISEIEKGK